MKLHDPLVQLANESSPDKRDIATPQSIVLEFSVRGETILPAAFGGRHPHQSCGFQRRIFSRPARAQPAANKTQAI
jgi:hypothetical protein